ncbi:hypothetical protein [Azospirillum sp. sgz302134]
MAGILRPAILILCAAVAACANERVTANVPASIYTTGEVAYAAADRDLRVIVYGDPFGIGPQGFGQRVTDGMQNRITGVQTNFTTVPNQTARPDYDVVLAFNPAQTMVSSYLCSGQPIETKPPGGPIVVQAAFCRRTGLFGLIGGTGILGLLGGGAMTSATGWLDHPQGPDDPAFKALIGDLTSALFPTEQGASTKH